MTSKLPRLFADDPPLKPLDSLDAIVDDWILRFGKNGKNKAMRDEVVEHCAAAASLQEATMRACMSLRPNGKMHNHQSRVKYRDRMIFRSAIASLFQITRGRLKNFDELFDCLDSIKPAGIGEVTVYDVATRIAAYLKLDITSLYLHAGVRIGWNKLHGTKSKAITLRVASVDLPTPLQRIPCDEAEDMLCAYRDYLQPWYKWRVTK